MKTKLLVAAAIAAAAIPASVSAQRIPAATIVVVDTNRILRECTACVAATAALEGLELAAAQRAVALGIASSVQGQPAALQREAQEIQTALNALQGRQPDAQLQTRVNNFRQRQQAAEQEFRALQQNYESTRVHVSVQLNQALEPIYNQVMVARGANLMLSTDARLAHAAALDVTPQVLAELNRQRPQVSITPMPQQQQQPAAQPVPAQPQQPRPTGR